MDIDTAITLLWIAGGTIVGMAITIFQMHFDHEKEVKSYDRRIERCELIEHQNFMLSQDTHELRLELAATTSSRDQWFNSHNQLQQYIADLEAKTQAIDSIRQELTSTEPTN